MNFTVILLSVLLSFTTIRSALSELTPLVRVELSPAGFHRDLDYTILFDYPLAGNDCEYYLEQKLPAAVYIDVDQLNGLARVKKLKAIYPSFVNVENPTEKAEPLSVLLFGMPKITDHITLPIHFRYHSPGDKRFVKVEIENPSMFLYCPDDKLRNFGLKASSGNYCINGTEFYQSNQTEPHLDCGWKHIEINVHLKTSLRAYIPIGDENLQVPVTCITLIISWIGCFCVIFALHNKKEIINKKLY